MAGSIRVGTCSWKYPSWAGLVYSRAEGIDYLAEYARKYSTVEIDQWFWAMPDPGQAESYRSVVPETFSFTVKAYGGLTRATQGRRGAQAKPNPDFLSAELYARFLDSLSGLRSSCGAVMLQFEYLNRQKIASEEEFLRRLDSFLALVPRDVPIAVETRNSSYLGREYFSLLRDRKAAHVFLQGYWMPQVPELYERCRDYLVGTPIVRLHGPDREGMEEATGGAWDRIVTPRDDELRGIAAMTLDMRKRGLDVYLNVNNHFEGSAPLTIQKLLALGVADS